MSAHMNTSVFKSDVIKIRTYSIKAFGLKKTTYKNYCDNFYMYPCEVVSA